jgi:hypothetical protein
MNNTIFTGTIDVTKINKNRLFKGNKGTYLNFSIVIREDVDQYGNIGFIAESTTKEDRESGEKGTILGNLKRIEKPSTPKPKQKNPEPIGEEDDLPF